MYTLEMKHNISTSNSKLCPKIVKSCKTLSFCFAVAMAVSVAAMFVIAGLRPHMWMKNASENLTKTQAASLISSGCIVISLYAVIILLSIFGIIMVSKNKIPAKYRDCCQCIAQVLFLVVSSACFGIASALVIGINAKIFYVSSMILASILAVLLTLYVIMPLCSGRSHKGYMPL